MTAVPLLALLLACSGGVDEARGPTLAEGAATTIFASQKALGPHVMDATVRRGVRSDAAPEQLTEERVVLRWQDDDNWQLTRARDGRTVESVLVLAGTAYTGEGEAAERRPDAEPYRVMLAQSWDPWSLAFEQVDGSLQLTDEAVEPREGRKAHRHAVSVRAAPQEDAAPPPSDGPRKRSRARARATTYTVTQAAGDVWIDESTAVRIAADVRVDAVSGGQTHRIELSFGLAEIGGEVKLPPPPTDAPKAGPDGTPRVRRPPAGAPRLDGAAKGPAAPGVPERPDTP